MEIKLSQTERQILANQNRILKYLDNENQTRYESNIEILTHGYEYEYPSVFDVHSDDQVINKEVCDETIDILNMFRKIDNAIALVSKDDEVIDEIEKLKFDGFDANNGNHFYYTEYMITKQNKWDEYHGKDINSRSITSIDKYRRMLNAMNERLSDTKFDLNKDDLDYIASKV